MKRTTLLIAALAIAVIATATPASAMRDPGAGAMPGNDMGLYQYGPPAAGRASVPGYMPGGPTRTGMALYTYGSKRPAAPLPMSARRGIVTPPRIGQTGLNNQYADGMNLYQYVGSNPAVYVDPSGLLKSYQCCTNAQTQTLKDDVNRAQKTILPQLVADVNKAIQNDTGQYPLLTGAKLKHAKDYLSCIDRQLTNLGSKCEKPGSSLTCDWNPTVYGWVKGIFASRIHICTKVYFGMGPQWRSGALIHEASHVCGSIDLGYFLNESPHDVLLTGWQDIADTYRYWATNGFCIPGFNCP